MMLLFKVKSVFCCKIGCSVKGHVTACCCGRVPLRELDQEQYRMFYSLISGAVYVTSIVKICNGNTRVSGLANSAQSR